MSEKTGETPNPLHQGAKTQPATGAGNLNANPAEPAHPTAAAPAPDPMARPMVKAAMPAEEPPKKKKTGLIIGLVVAILVLAGAGITAAILLAGGNSDPVAKALDKLASGNVPQYVKVDGTIEVESDDSSSMLSKMSLKLQSDMDTKSSASDLKATLVADISGSSKLSLDLEAISTEGGDIYLNISGIEDAVTEYIKMVAGTSGASSKAIVSYYMSAFGDVFDSLDGKWLKVSTDDLKSLSESMNTGSQATCVTDLAEEINKGDQSLVDAYRNNPFISSTTEGVTLASKGSGPVYKVVVDKEAYNSFKEKAKESTLIKKAANCLNTTTSTGTTDLSEGTDIYVEVDNDSNFTRLYTSKSATEDCCPDGADCYRACATMKATIDFSFSYPSSLTIEEPSDAKDLMTTLQKIFGQYTSGPTVDIYDDDDDDDDDYDIEDDA
ncbi:hypothetical protein IKF20_00435 [Candidatus Saccharibacteria bacterium]|nr:hypothetical protein [Candidatus Saccharibacteria bacterium]